MAEFRRDLSNSPNSDSDLEGENEFESDGDGDVEGDELSSVSEKESTSKPKSKKKGRRSSWSQETVDDMIDVICEDEYIRRKLIFTNNKSSKNAEVYETVIKRTRERCVKRGKKFDFSVSQTRTKFKNCVAICKRTAMMRKTASGISDFVQSKGYGKWFLTLLSYVQSRDSCQPDQGIEPSSLNKELKDFPEQETESELSYGAGTSSEARAEEEGEPLAKKKMYVPIKKKKGKTSFNVHEEFKAAVTSFNKALENDPVKELTTFFSEENKRAREHEKTILDMQMQMQMQMMQFLSSSNSQQNYGPNQLLQQTTQAHGQQWQSYSHSGSAPAHAYSGHSFHQTGHHGQRYHSHDFTSRNLPGNPPQQQVDQFNSVAENSDSGKTYYELQ